MSKRILIIFVLALFIGNSYGQRGRVNITGGFGPGGVSVGVGVGGYYGGYRPGMHMHYGWYRPGWYYPVGWGVATLATTAIVVSAINSSNNTAVKSEDGKVYYDNGLYYVKSSDGYKVIPPPNGAEIPSKSIPDGYTVVKRGSQEFLYAAGAFYETTSNGNLIVVSAPIGVKVPYLPKEGINEVEYKGSVYYELYGVYYLPIQTGTQIMYKVMPKPGTNADDKSNFEQNTEVAFPDYEQIVFQGVQYYYKDGKFHVLQSGKLIEVIAPVGIRVSSIPEKGVQNITGKDGNLYYQYGLTYFQATVVNGSYIYIVAKPK